MFRFGGWLAWLGSAFILAPFSVNAAEGTPAPVPIASPAASAAPVSISPESLTQGASASPHETPGSVFQSVSSEVATVFAKCKAAVVRISASDDYGVHSGTGFFIDPNGTLYSHYRVAGRSWNLTVEVADKKYPATCLLADPRSGAALLKIQAEGTPFLPIGNSSEIQVMSPIITVGYPMDLGVSPSFGFVAGLDGKFLGRFLPTTHIRANVVVQSGEQGAPVLNIKGEVIGILAFGYEGSNCYALPIQAAEKVRSDYTRFGEARYGWIGVNAEPVIEGDENCEVKITHLDADTPAANSGLKDGDVLVSVGSKKIRRFGDLRDASFFLTADEKVPITIKRGGDEDLVPMGSLSSIVPLMPIAVERLEQLITLDVRAANPPGKYGTTPQGGIRQSSVTQPPVGARMSLPQGSPTPQ